MPNMSNGVTSFETKPASPAAHPVFGAASAAAIHSICVVGLEHPVSARRDRDSAKDGKTGKQTVQLHLPGHPLKTPPYLRMPRPLRVPKRSPVFETGTGERVNYAQRLTKTCQFAWYFQGTRRIQQVQPGARCDAAAAVRIADLRAPASYFQPEPPR